MKKLLAVAGVILFALLAVGCGAEEKSTTKDGGVGDLTEKSVIDKLAANYRSSTADAASAKEATCFATEFVEEAGLKALLDAKVIDKSGELVTSASSTFDKDLASKYAAAFTSCVDYPQRMAASQAAANKKISASVMESCLRKELTDETLTRLIVATQTQAADAADLQSQLQKTLTGCEKKATRA